MNILTAQNLQVAANGDHTDIYLYTLGLLLTAPGHQTALNLHEQVFFEKLTDCKTTEALVWLQNEILIIERLLTSNNNRLNKSSALWYFYRKLLVLAMDMKCGHLKFIETVIHSGKRHFSNYYSWATARWLYDVISATAKADLLEATLKFCVENVRDASAWSALSHMVCQHTEQSHYSFGEFKRLRKLLKLQVKDSYEVSRIPLEVEWYVTKIKSSIDMAAAEEWPPYLCLLTLVIELPEPFRFGAFSSWHGSIVSFEKKQGTIELLRNNPIVPSEIAGNALLSRTARHLGFKKLFLLQLHKRSPSDGGLKSIDPSTHIHT